MPQSPGSLIALYHGYSSRYNGKVHPHIPKLSALLVGMAARSCSPKKVVVINSVLPEKAGDWQSDWETWEGFMSRGREVGLGRDHSGEIQYKREGFNWPLWILFSSGTTGKCKLLFLGPHVMKLACFYRTGKPK